MKKITIILTFSYLCLYFSFGQISPCDITVVNDVYTPLGSVVISHIYDCEYDEGVRAKRDNDDAATYPNAIQIKTYDGYSSTLKFNCHGYAWLRVEQGIDRWVSLFYYNYPDTIDIPYYVDGSYTQVSSETFPAKVYWDHPENHSAITTEQPSWFISKWDWGPLCYHRWDDCPYTGTLKKKKKNCHPVIQNMSITADRNMNSCGDITFINDTISNNAVVNIHAQDAVYLKPDFRAVAGTNVTITVGGASSAPTNNSMVFTNVEPIWKEPILHSLASNDTDFTDIKPSFTLYPNPNSGVFQLEANFPLSDIVHLKITTPLGISVYETKNLASKTIQLYHSASGMFFVVIVLKDGNVLTQKMMVQR
jgi:hypothetical protein